MVRNDRKTKTTPANEGEKASQQVEYKCSHDFETHRFTLERLDH